ncbi:hypothetical protein PV327_007053 [Microctonus hyperodae]|uniref:Platelet-derived growth factor (PDGF) family profile domain-containing protein n=1 Tax=Microctonus hyperodae TaxID=165561 RepID=A0AA39F5K0_MICHY|nr:hypothetical protein PV327_007053 [Microctonus hyperodae]
MNRRYFILILFIIIGSSCFGKFHHHQDSSYLNHVQLVRQFECSLPQPRAIPVEELLSVGPSPDEIFFPSSTVLKRCAGAGCCFQERQICSPIETKNISLVFLVQHRFDHQRDRHHEIIHAVQHTKCKCMNRDEESFVY